MQASEYLTEDYVTEKVLTILGDGDRVEEVLKNKDLDDMKRTGDIADEDEPSDEMDGQGAESLGEENK